MATWGEHEHGVTPDHRDQVDPPEGDQYDPQEENQHSFYPTTLDADAMLRELHALGMHRDAGI